MCGVVKELEIEMAGIPHRFVVVLFLCLVFTMSTFALKSFRSFKFLSSKRSVSTIRVNTVPAKLSECVRVVELSKLSQQGWELENNRDAIKKTFLFQDFTQAFTFMTKIAFKAESMQHHPEWFNVYNRLNVVLSTHDCDGLSALDVTMANYMDQEYLRHK